jgi:branched-subunit amino acid transport protein
MSFEPLVLIALMAAVTYIGRALPLLVPGTDRLPGPLVSWIALVAPATLAALAASSTLLARSGDRTVLATGPLLAAVATALVVMSWRRNLPLAIMTAVLVAAGLRWLG